MNPKRILVVDDNPSIIETVTEQLSTLNDDWIIMTAENGKECIKRLKECNKKSEKVDLVVLDIMMPVMDGWDTSAEIRSDDKFKDIPIIFLTAKNDDISKGLGSVNSVDYIDKPFDMFDLNKRIRKVLANNKR